MIGLPSNDAEKRLLEEELAALSVTNFGLETAAADSDNGILYSPNESTSSSMYSSDDFATRL
jgi:hypothetical protein